MHLCPQVSKHDVDVCVIGAGPSGLGVAMALSKSRLASSTLLLDAGLSTELRSCTILQGKGCRFANPCQVISGVGGASVLSGGKISGLPAGRELAAMMGEFANEKMAAALGLFQQFVRLERHQGPENGELLDITNQYAEKGFHFRYYDASTYTQDDLLAGYNAMVRQAVLAGAQLHLETTATKIERDGASFRIQAEAKGSTLEIKARHLVLASGRHGSSLLRELNGGLGLKGTSTRLDVGIRMEFPTETWPDIDAAHNDLKLHFGNARTFCVCKNGTIAPYRMNGIFLLEGHAEPNGQTGLTNLAVTCRLDFPDSLAFDETFGEICRRMIANSGGKPVRQMLESVLDENKVAAGSHPNASITYWKWGHVLSCYPPPVAANIKAALSKFTNDLLPAKARTQASVFAPEMDYYWPSIPTDECFETNIPNLRIVGDATGRFRGILQAFCSGSECGRAILEMTHA